MSEREDLILVRWQDEQDGGWREGVVCCVDIGLCYTHLGHLSTILEHVDAYKEPCYRAIIYDRHRHQRAIVPLAKVQIVEPRCDVCEGTCHLRKTEWISIDGMPLRSETPCLVCHGSWKRA